MEKKKTKLTISGNPKKSFKNFDTAKNQTKKTVIIERQTNKPVNKSNLGKSFGSKSSSNFKRGMNFKSNLSPKISTVTSDFEKRKLAEQRATKRLKDDKEIKDKKTKLGPKRENLNLLFPGHLVTKLRRGKEVSPPSKERDKKS